MFREASPWGSGSRRALWLASRHGTHRSFSACGPLPCHLPVATRLFSRRPRFVLRRFVSVSFFLLSLSSFCCVLFSVGGPLPCHLPVATRLFSRRPRFVPRRIV